MRRFPLAILTSSLATVVLAAFTASLAAQSSPRRVVAVGDIHGALTPFVAILQSAQLLDASQRWTGGRATLVQTGDFTDRGADVRAVMDLLMALEPQARAAGGRVRTLLGNHEVMNLIGEQRDVTPAIYATFADAQSEALREDAYRRYVALAAARARVRPDVAAVYTSPRETWMAAHPPGWLEYRAAFAPKGRYGAWLRSLRPSLKADGTLFMHAGVNPLSADIELGDVDTVVAAEIARVDRFLRQLVDAKLALPFFTLNEMLQVAADEIRAVNAIVAAAKAKGTQPDLRGFKLDLLREAAAMVSIGDWSLLAEQGPLWYRGYAASPEATLRTPVAAFLARHQITRVVVGHTPVRERRIQVRLGGSVVLIDTGMLASAYKGRPAALELVGDELTAIYEDQRVPLATGPSPAARVGGLQR